MISQGARITSRICNVFNDTAPLIFAKILPTVTTGSKRLSSAGMAVNGVNGSGGRRGALIVLEGCDRAGKSTQCRLLVDALNKSGSPSHLFGFPDRTTAIGKVIDEYLKCSNSLSDEAIHLLFSANRWELVPTIRSLLLKGESVILDRYAFSGIAFSAAKGMDLEWCKAPDVGLPQPDRVFFLNLSKEAASARGDFGKERYERTEFQEKVRKIFLKIQEASYWTVIDADRTKEAVHEDLFKLSIEALKSCEENPCILPLWSTAPKNL